MKINSPEQFEAMKKIGIIVANCLAYLKAKTVVGMSTLEVDHLAAEYLAEHGAVSAPKVTYDFPGFTCISVEKDCAHGIPSDRILKDNDLVNIDVSASLDGFFADNGESFVVGNASPEKQFLCDAVKTALNRSIQNAKAGVPLRFLGRTVEQVARKKKLRVIENLGGHGVGRSLHEEPSFIPGFEDKKDKRILRENQVIAFEPFLSTHSNLVQQKDDGWTLYANGYTVQKEHTLMVTKNKPYIFTQPTKSFT